MAGARKSALWSQTNTLMNKNFTIMLSRHFVSTLYTALMLPVLFSLYLGILRQVGGPQDEYGIGEPRAVRDLSDALGAADSSRDTVVLINNGHSGGDIDDVLDILAKQVSDAGRNATKVASEDELGFICKASYQGASNCFGAVSFHSSPDEGSGSGWNYTLRGDRALGSGFKVNEKDNDPQVYTLPLQRAVDRAIARVSSGGDEGDLDGVEEWAFTDKTEEEREAEVRRQYQKSFTQFNSLSLIVIFFGIAYRLPGSMATEREKGLSQLIDAMMPTAHDYEAQLARTLSFLGSYLFVYLPGWIVGSVIVHFFIWKETSIGIIIVFFILAGLSLTSLAILLGTFFKKAQLSGAVSAIVTLLLAVLAQAIPDPPTGAVAVLSALFAPCNIIFHFIYIARYEQDGKGADLITAPDRQESGLPAIAHWVFALAQFLVYPIIAAILERAIHGVAAESRKVFRGGDARPDHAVRISGLTKVYRPSLLRRIFSFIVKPRAETVAVDNLDLTVPRGQIVSLLGANGSGKSTTLDAVAGISRFSQGTISIDASQGIGIAPQKNVLWDELSVEEHLTIFNKLKSPTAVANADQMTLLMDAVGLTQKRSSQTHTLSGGQKRKLQLGMMLTGGSGVCCVDEVSSGIDPLSRRKIWDILLSERGKRTIILTTHFLDEADLLSDDIAILSKGTLKAQGSPVALKHQLGAGYRVHVLDAKHVRNPPTIHNVSRQVTSTNIIYTAPSSELAAEVIKALEAARIEYRLSSPTIEDVFLQVADEIKGEAANIHHDNANANISSSEASPSQELSEKAANGIGNTNGHLELLSGKQTGFFKQVMTLIRKRITLFKTNWVPYVVAFIVPIVAAAGTQSLLKNPVVTCDPENASKPEDTQKFDDQISDAHLVAGPGTNLESLVAALPSSYEIDLQSSFSGMRSYIESNREDITPGGWWMGSSDQGPLFAYRADDFSSVYSSVISQNILNSLKSNISISTQYRAFDRNTPPSLTDSIMVSAFFCLAVCIAPAFFGFYPNVERRSNVRGLQYSSGVRSLPQWISHLFFDYSIFFVAFVGAAIAFAVSPDHWYNVDDLFPVFLLYALVTILLAYNWSMFMKSQLSTFAGIFIYNMIGFAIYFISFLFIITFSSAPAVEQNVLIAHYVISALFPIGSLFRTFMVGLNLFSSACDEFEFYSYPGHLSAYGGPILYLTVQAVLLFSLLLFYDSGNKLPSFLSRNKSPQGPSWRPDLPDQEGANDLVQAQPNPDKGGLQVENLVKVFGKNTAVDNVSFGVQHGEVFALLGPNGAGKSTTISLIRGDMQPSPNGGDVFVENVSVSDHRALARANLGVCPQFDAIDNMTVVEHLQHYARLRGIDDVDRQVDAVVRAVGLEAFTNTMAPHLSGGNKRKLSLAIALTGNPSVILLDEPSSGLDAAAKRIMWRTLETIVPGRAILLTTHSMEEADALASRAGILARRMLAMGGVNALRNRFGDSLYVHLVSASAPHSTADEMARMRAWVQHMFPGAQIEPDTYHGQMRFSVPASEVLERSRASNPPMQQGNSDASAIGQLIVMLEENKRALGIEHHSVSPTTLNDVFLSIVGQHNVQEEGYEGGDKQESKWVKARKAIFMF